MIVLIFPDTKYRSKVWFLLSDKIDTIKNCGDPIALNNTAKK
jgi:hypothetical protein